MKAKFHFVANNLNKEQLDLLCPRRQSELASGLDLACASMEDIVIAPKSRALIPTGVAIELLPGCEAQVRSRSGLAWKHGIAVLNAPGTIDADYRGEIKVVLINHGEEEFRVSFGMRIAQLVLAPVFLMPLEEARALEDSARGEQGFGSTGIEVNRQ